MSIRIADIIHMFDQWAPTWVAWEKDNVGLQIGDRKTVISKILVTLDVTDAVVAEAVLKKTDLIISHHPLIFRPLKSMTTDDPIGSRALKLAENKIALFSAHTNLDFTKDGVSFSLAQKLGLSGIKFLTGLKDSLAKIIVFVPESHLVPVRNAMAHAGAGMIGEYSSCSFTTKGTGSFIGSADSSPAIGKAQQLQLVDEVRLEMVVPRASMSNVITAMKRVHPYEEVAYDIFSLNNTNANFGMGAIGTLPNPQSLGSFLHHCKHTLGNKAIRYTGDVRKNVQTIAVCGGSGGELLPEARAHNADVFVTADVRYHDFQDASSSLALVDAGHWETEQVILQPIVHRIRALGKEKQAPLAVSITKTRTNPISIL